MDRFELPDMIVDFRREGARRSRKLVMPGASAPTAASAHSPHIRPKVAIPAFAVLPAEAVTSSTRNWHGKSVLEPS